MNSLTLIDTIFLPRTKALSVARDVVLVFSFALLTGISAQLKLDIGAIPITGQTLIVLLAGALLGAKRGALSQIFYLSFGLMGLPWFSRGGGIPYILSPTIGYIIGFIFAAYFIGWLSEKGFNKKFKTCILIMLIGNLLIYIPGLLYLAKFTGLANVLAIGFYPFIFGDIIKIILAGMILPIVWKIIK